jgi:hypothetical protein
MGFFVCALVRGLHSATDTDYALIGIPTNAAVYAAIILILLLLIRRPESN